MGVHSTNTINPESAHNYKVVRQLTIMTVVWGIVGMIVGVLIAVQLVWPGLNSGLPWTSLGRLRLLHTDAAISAFSGCASFATSYCAVWRICQVRLFSGTLASSTFWGRQLVILLAAASLPLGYTLSKEYVKLEQPIGILITMVWATYAVVLFDTLVRRRAKYIHVGNQFLGGSIPTTAMLHVVNSLELPVTFTKSYSLYADATDAMIQWRYGHNVVGFFPTAGFLGMMYYFVPKQVERPAYSYCLSITHFWVLIVVYIWAGPHHLHYTALSNQAQPSDMVTSLILLVPGWGGMINGMMTLSGTWHKLRSDPILRFLAVSLAFYGMSTFEDPMTAVRTANTLPHYADWTVGHVHVGVLDWVAMVPISSLYHLIPKVFGCERMYSPGLINACLWLTTTGIMLYIVPMRANSITQGLAWRTVNEDGTLTYSFVGTLTVGCPGFVVCMPGGFVFLLGMFLMAYSTWRTVNAAKPTEYGAVAQIA